MDGFSLAATNYTDPAGFTHLYVFSQSTNNTLLASVWDSQNTTWRVVSISHMLATGGLELSFMPNTPITAYAYTNPFFQMRLYALTDGSSIREVQTQDPSLETGWQKGRLGFDSFLTVGQGSKLAALRPQCGTGRDCRNNFP
ncbi:hypothetical protein C8A01DRAFT_42229 [Parachaetomium inaequale]|uniref:Fucose-specific lectin n=1 Tax=Parachaetomium inaequale TaxID=2588326 RepID=A0AAN6P3Z2_9PEZI|nr:hypothetical protein C8A01DRAFT_42229 [Parachaetomium inaequale]